MQAIILQISSLINVAPVDVYVIFGLLLLFGIFCFLGITKIYEILFGLVLGISIFIVFQFLLINPNLTVPTFIDVKISKFIIGMSIYLIFILSMLVPLNSSLNIKETKNLGFKIIQTLFLAGMLTIFYATIIVGFINKSYIYKIDNAFALLKKASFWTSFVTESKLYPIISIEVPTITLLCVFFVFYIITFNDMVNLLVISMIETFKKMIKNTNKSSGGGAGGGHH